ncbi:MAG TPA: ABC transporter substrate-binding protein [Fimbriimonas sp.]|nr:ABC transporter substrate-binding protein [Fimbriimonas sp.]
MARASDFLLPTLGLVALSAVVLSEQLVKPTPHPGRVKVTYWEKWTGFEFSAMKAVVDDFNRSQDKIWVDILPISSIDQKTMMATSAGIPPDLAGLFGPNVPQYVDDGAILALDEMCAEAGIKAEDYIPAYYEIGRYNGKLWSLPTTPASTALHYNVAMLKEAGLDATKPPQTIKELDAYAAKVTVKKDGRLDKSGFMPSEPGWWNWAWGGFYGGRLWNGKDKITAASPENIRAFTWIADYSKKYGAGELQTFRSGFGNFSSPQNAFMSEKVAMELQGVWMYNFISQFSPKLQWAAAPFPHPEDRPDLAETSIVDEDVIVIPRGAKHPKEAFEFIKYLQSQPAMEKLCLGQQKNSPLRKVSEGFWRNHKNPYIKLFNHLAYSKNALVPPKVGIWTQYSSEMTTAYDSIALLKKTPEQALKDVEARMQPLLDQYLERKRMRETTAK